MFRRILTKHYLLALLSGALAAATFIYHLFIPSFFCLFPLFICIEKAPPLTSAKSGIFFGLALSFFSFFWMVQGAERFTGSGIIYGIAVFLLSAVLFSVFWGFTTWCCSHLMRRMQTSRAALLRALAIACVWIIAEQMLAAAAVTFPWFGYRAGFGLAGNLRAVQPAAYLGAGVLSFIAVLCNYLIAGIIAGKQYRKLWLPAIPFLLYMLTGLVILKVYEPRIKNNKSFRVAIASQNVEPEMEWNEATGNRLAHGLINLAADAAREKPRLVLWTESSIPWTYRPDDELLKEIIKAVPNTEQVIGINTDHTENAVYNSAYHFNSAGTATARYDKQFPLGLIEKPVAGVIFPFLSQAGYRVTPGSGAGILKTGYGRAGIFICNESSIAQLATRREREGADFFLNLSNDGWFADSYLADAHFYNALLRAVECRKDMAVCSNRGWCGMISSTGGIAYKTKDEEPRTQSAEICPNHFQTFYSRYPFFLFTCSVLYLLFVLCRPYASKIFSRQR